MLEKYIEQDLNKPRYLFHGSPKILENIEVKESHDSNGTKHNIDTAIFLTQSFLLATAYSFKDRIKDLSINNGLKYNFTISNYESSPVMIMENVAIPENLEGYVYVFEFDEKFINDPLGSLQYKSYTNLEPIDILKINYDDFKHHYEIKRKTRWFYGINYNHWLLAKWWKV